MGPALLRLLATAASQPTSRNCYDNEKGKRTASANPASFEFIFAPIPARVAHNLVLLYRGFHSSPCSVAWLMSGARPLGELDTDEAGRRELSALLVRSSACCSSGWTAKRDAWLRRRAPCWKRGRLATQQLRRLLRRLLPRCAHFVPVTLNSMPR